MVAAEKVRVRVVGMVLSPEPSESPGPGTTHNSALEFPLPLQVPLLSQ